MQSGGAMGVNLLLTVFILCLSGRDTNLACQALYLGYRDVKPAVEDCILSLTVLTGKPGKNGQGVNGVLCVCLTGSRQVYMISDGKISAQTILHPMSETD